MSEAKLSLIHSFIYDDDRKYFSLLLFLLNATFKRR